MFLVHVEYVDDDWFLSLVYADMRYIISVRLLVLFHRYVDHDLTGLLDERYEFQIDEIKSIMRQLLEVRSLP